MLQTLAFLPLLGKISISILFWILALSFFVVQIILRKNVSPAIGHCLYWIGNTWLVFILYTAIIYALISLLNYFFVPIPYGIFISMIFAILAISYGFINFSHPKIKHQSIEIKKTIADKQNMKVVFISDVHLGYGINSGRLQKFVKTINDQQADAIFIGGDLIDMNIYPVEKAKMYEYINRLSAKDGIFMVMGNHDYICGQEKTINFIKKTHITLLKDTILILPNGLQIIGRDDKSNKKRQSIAELTKHIDFKQPTILLDHQPDNETINEIVRKNIDLGLFGHTHHGQFFPINLITSILYKHSYGYEYINHTHIYTSSGIGLWGPPVRLGSNSEIVVFDILF